MAKKENFNEMGFDNILQSDEIDYLPWPECVKVRPDTYIGGVDRLSMNVLLREIYDNSADECYKSANKVVIDRNFNGLALVGDNGRGISIEYNKKVPGVISADLSISSMHSGAKFPKGKGQEKLSTSGKNGVGSSCVNALSTDYILLSWITPLNWDKSTPEVKALWESCGPRSKKELFYIVWYKQGVKHFEGAMKKKDIEAMLFGHLPSYKEIPAGLSTVVMFSPDPDIFKESAEFASSNGLTMAQAMELPTENMQYFLLIQEKFLKKKVRVFVDGNLVDRSGFVGFDNEFIKTVKPSDDTLNAKVDFFISFDANCEIGPSTLRNRKANYYGSVNGLAVNSGIHLNWIEECYCAALKKAFEIDIPDRFLPGGLRLCVVARAGETSFSSQTKEDLKGIPGLTKDDLEPIVKEFQKIFKSDPEYWNKQVSRLLEYADSMKSLSASAISNRMMTNAGSNGGFLYKGERIKGFADATIADSKSRELFLCEGLSAGGGLKSGRVNDPILGGIANAILPLRGKILNVKDADEARAAENKEIFTYFSVLGCGMGRHNCLTKEGVLGNYEAEEEVLSRYLRYDKIILCTDGDQDGSHIQNLILYSTAKFNPFLITHKKVYICKAPLFYQDGKYFYPGDPLQEGTIFPVGLNQSKSYSRWKGLGSIPKNHVYNSFFNPATRRLVLVTPEDISGGTGLIENLSDRKKLLYDNGVLR